MFYSFVSINKTEPLTLVNNINLCSIHLSICLFSFYIWINLFQYFSPYSSADLNLMAKAFDTNVANLENELAVLIQDGSIKARIDSHKQVILLFCVVLL